MPLLGTQDPRSMYQLNPLSQITDKTLDTIIIIIIIIMLLFQLRAPEEAESYI
jgi:hypothetical protein